MSKTATIPEFNLISFEIHPKAPLPSLLQTPPHNNTPKKTAKFTYDIKVRKKRGKSMRQKQVMKKKGKRKEKGKRMETVKTSPRFCLLSAALWGRLFLVFCSTMAFAGGSFMKYVVSLSGVLDRLNSCWIFFLSSSSRIW